MKDTATTEKRFFGVLEAARAVPKSETFEVDRMIDKPGKYAVQIKTAMLKPTAAGLVGIRIKMKAEGSENYVWDGLYPQSGSFGASRFLQFCESVGLPELESYEEVVEVLNTGKPSLIVDVQPNKKFEGRFNVVSYEADPKGVLLSDMGGGYPDEGTFSDEVAEALYEEGALEEVPKAAPRNPGRIVAEDLPFDESDLPF